MRKFAFLAMAALLCVLIAIWLAPYAPSPRPIRAAAAGSPQTPLNKAAHHVSDAARAILARPLFAAGRRAPVVLTRTTESATKLPRLAGTLIMPTRKLAIFAGAPHGAVLQEGDMFAGMTVARVASGRVTLQAPGNMIDLFVAPSGLSAATAMPPQIMPRLADRAPDGQHEE